MSPAAKVAESQTVVASSGLVQMFLRDAKLHSWELPERGERGGFWEKKIIANLAAEDRVWPTGLELLSL